ncbi:glycosyltransferase [Patescibacteria group bacterium]
MKVKKLPISAVMVIHNEEKRLEKSLKSFTHLVDEIIIIHDGKCTDRSISIAKKFTKKVFIKPFIGEAEPHRPFSYKTAKHNWILQVDADEYLSGRLQKNLFKLIRKKVDVYDLPWVRLQKNKYFPGLYKRALFKKNKIYLIGAPHEHPKPINNFVIIKKAVPPLIHKVKHASDWIVFKTKWLPWIKIQAKYYTMEFSKIPKWNCELKDWEAKTKIRIEHPIIFGIIGHVVYLLIFNLVEFIKKRDVFYLQELIFKPLFLLVLYTNIIKLKQKRLRSKNQDS